jgi:beta-lactamase class A
MAAAHGGDTEPTADPWRQLQQDVRLLAAQAGGQWGIVFKDLRHDDGVRINAESVFPGASIIKTALLVETLRQVAAGQHRLTEEIAVDVDDEENAKLGSGVLVHLHKGIRVTVGDLCELMINLSDNVASNLLLELVGMESVNSNLRSLGIQNTRFTRRFGEFAALRSPHGNPVTAGELANLFECIWKRQLPGSEAAVDYLGRCSSNTRIPLLLPEQAHVYHKTGTLTGIVHDAGIVNSGQGAYVLVCLSGAGESNVVAANTMAQMSLAVWRAFQQRA